MNYEKCDHSHRRKKISHHQPTTAGPYICPMHPEIKEDLPGECPICGMALEPEIISPDEQENVELIDLRKRFWVGFLFCLPIVLLEMIGHFTNIENIITHHTNLYIQFFFSIFVIFWAGAPFFIKAYKSLLNKTLNMFSLVSLGTVSTFLYSSCVILFPSIFPSSFKDLYGTIPVYFESASVIVVLVLLGQILELKAREKTGGAIKSLLNLTPKNAMLVTKSGDKDISINHIAVGNILRIRPGEKIPVDGIVTSGETYIDESMITGETLPASKKINDVVIGGTINTSGAITIKATKVGSDTMLANIIKLVLQAQRSRAKIQSLVDVIANWFVPIVILVALTAFISWLLLAKDQGLSYGLIAAVSVLIIACPCALGLATPMSLIVGIGKGAKNGILVKDAESLETLEKVDTIIFDKTGTLTEGKPKISHIHPVNDSISKGELLQLAASLEAHSEHPLALAITKAAKEEKIKLLEVRNFKAIIGEGIAGKVKEENILCGNDLLMKNLNLLDKSFLKMVDELRSQGETVTFLSREESVIGFIAINDPIKKSSFTAIQQLKKMNVKVIMLTGDSLLTAKSVAKKLGIKNYKAQVKPEDKAKVVLEYKEKGHIVAMIGDGINDAPALSTSDIGIAMGSGTDVAIENAGITLLKGNMLKLYGAIHLSRAVMRNIKENLFLAFVYNACGIPLAAGVLYPFFGILLSPIFAAVAMSLSSVSVIGNALRLNLKKIF
mgnify:CR=1 FL=1